MKIQTLIASMLLFTTAAVAQNITDEAVMYFKLDEQQAETVPVNSVNNKPGKYAATTTHGEVVNDPDHGWVRSSIAGKTGFGFAQPIPVSGSSARTISFWAYVDKKCVSVKGTEIIQGIAQIVNVGNATNKHGLFNVQIFRGNSVRLSTDKLSSVNILFEGSEELRDAWHHYTIVIEEGGATDKIKAYVDGEILPAGTPVDFNGNTLDHYVINTTKSGGVLSSMFTGKLADFIIFDRALSSDEIKDVMDLTK